MAVSPLKSFKVKVLSQETTGRRKVLDQPFLGVTSWPGLICTSAWVTGVTVHAFINHISRNITTPIPPLYILVLVHS